MDEKSPVAMDAIKNAPSPLIGALIPLAAPSVGRVLRDGEQEQFDNAEYRDLVLEHGYCAQQPLDAPHKGAAN